MACTLYTLPFSHFCEAARWALREARFAFVEKPYLPGVHKLASVGFHRNGKLSLPFLAGEGRAVKANDSWACLALAGIGDVPPDLKTLLDETLGPCTRAIVYSHLLHGKADAMDPLDQCKLMPLWQRNVFRTPAADQIYRSMRKTLVRRAGHVNACSACVAETSARVLEPMLEADPDFGLRQRDGGPSAAGIALASLYAPLVFPRKYCAHFYGDAGFPIVLGENAPDSLVAEVRNWRETRCGQWTLDFYDRHYHLDAPETETSGENQQNLNNPPGGEAGAAAF